MDVCYPSNLNNKTTCPVVFLINGECGSSSKLNPKFKAVLESWGKLLAVSGVIAINFTWRYKRPEDISDIIEYIRNNARELKIDREQMCIFSFSRGVSISIDHIFKFNYDFKKCDDFIDTVRSKGVELVELVYLAHESGDHVFDMRNNDEQSHSIIKKTVEFIKNMLTKTHQIVAPDIFMLCPRKRDKK